MNIKKTVLYTLLTLLVVTSLMVAFIFFIAFYRVGEFDKSTESLTTCQNYSYQEAKNTVLFAYFKKEISNNKTEYARQLANDNGVKFDDRNIQKSQSSWLIPFSTLSEGKVVKKFGVIECETLHVEFSTDTGH